MARGINKVILIGNLGSDPEVRYTPNNSAVVTVSIATSSAWKDKQTGENQERTEWHRVVFFNRLAEIVNEYLRKGSKVYVEGSLRTRKWTDTKTNTEKFTTEIIANEMQMLDGRGAGQSASASDNAGRADTMATNTSSAAPSASSHDFDDDIPF